MNASLRRTPVENQGRPCYVERSLRSVSLYDNGGSDIARMVYRLAQSAHRGRGAYPLDSGAHKTAGHRFTGQARRTPANVDRASGERERVYLRECREGWFSLDAIARGRASQPCPDRPRRAENGAPRRRESALWRGSPRTCRALFALSGKGHRRERAGIDNACIR
jgi:hypothetical protein